LFFHFYLFGNSLFIREKIYFSYQNVSGGGSTKQEVKKIFFFCSTIVQKKAQSF